MGNPNHPSFEALNKTLESLKEIRSALIPFIQLLKDDDELNSPSKEKRGDDSKVNNEKLTPHKRAEAQAAVALAIGTLRYMGARIRGLDRGRKKDDPLRIELNKIRGMLVSLRKIESAEKDDGKRATPKIKNKGVKVDATTAKPIQSSNSTKRKKAVETKNDECNKRISSPTKRQKR